MVEHLLCKQRVAGSSPTISTNEGVIALRTLKVTRVSLSIVLLCLLCIVLYTIKYVSKPEVFSGMVFHVENIALIEATSPKLLAKESSKSLSDTELKPQPYIYEAIPFGAEMQYLVWQASEESGCPYELALAVIWCESRYQNITGDNGNSIGYMQIQPKWHHERMEALGVTDLSDPLSNFRVGCNLLSELLDKYTLEEALTCYNTGSPGKSSYADNVMAYMNDTFTN